MVGFGFLLKYTTVTFGQVEGSLVYHRTLSAAQLSFGFQWAVDWPMGLVAPLWLLEKKGQKVIYLKNYVVSVIISQFETINLCICSDDIIALH